MSLSRAGSTLAQVPQDAYGFGEDASREADRLAAAERAVDPPTWSALLEVGVDLSWRCWDVGTGRGSIARWLARVVGPRGKVLATDLEDRRLGADLELVVSARTWRIAVSTQTPPLSSSSGTTSHVTQLQAVTSIWSTLDCYSSI
jgi:hypothetical protein